MTASTDSAVPSFAPPAPYDVADADVLAALPGRMMQSAEQIVAVRGSQPHPGGPPGVADFDHDEKTAPGLDDGPPVPPSAFSPKERPA